MATEDAEKFRAASLKALEELRAMVAEGNAILKDLKALAAKAPAAPESDPDEE